MTFDSTINIEDYIKRGAAILRKNEILRNPESGKSLVTSIKEQSPPQEVNPNNTIIPVVYVTYSNNSMIKAENIGRDSLDAQGARYYEIEFYNIIIADGIDKETAQAKCQQISQVIRDVYARNMRMTLEGNDPVCATLKAIAVPRVLRSETPNIQSLNVVCRLKVPVSLLQ